MRWGCCKMLKSAPIVDADYWYKLIDTLGGMMEMCPSAPSLMQKVQCRSDVSVCAVPGCQDAELVNLFKAPLIYRCRSGRFISRNLS